jgi:hypothetical protein
VLRKGSEADPAVADRAVDNLDDDVRADFVSAVAAFFAGRRLGTLTKLCKGAFELSVLITVGVLLAAAPNLWLKSVWIGRSLCEAGKATGVAFDDARFGGTSLSLVVA